MSNRNKHSELWQQKRNELPIGTNMHTDWSEMQNLLDQQMPVSGNSGVGNQGTGASPTYLAKLAKFKLLFAAAGLIIAGTVTYLAIPHKAGQSTSQNKIELSKDSVLANQVSIADSAAQASDNTAANQAGDNSNPAVNATTAHNIAKPSDVAENNTKETEKVAAAEKKDLANSSVSSRLANNNRLANGLHNGNRRALSPAVNHNSRFKNSAGYQSSGYSLQNNDGDIPGALATDQQRTGNQLIPGIGATSQPLLTWEDIISANFNKPVVPENSLIAPIRPLSSNQKIKAEKETANSNFDWGLLIGAGTKGSFTAKAQNHNIYGSLPVDIYAGVFGAYNFSEHWALGLQSKFLVPHTINGHYSHTHQVLIDTPQNIKTPETLQISDSRKVYTVDIPLHVIYKVSPGFNIKAGPTLSIPVKETNGSGTFTTKTLLDSPAYYHSVTNNLKATRAEKKLNYGASAGIGFNLDPVSFEATYNYNFKQQKVSSLLGGYSIGINSVQFTIGIKLNKQKK